MYTVIPIFMMYLRVTGPAVRFLAKSTPVGNMSGRKLPFAAGMQENISPVELAGV